jgi:curved DNA-binding protein CbpA
MEVINYYQILEVKYDATEKEINDAYKNKIKKYFNLPFLNENQKVDVKELKKAKFIFSNNELKKNMIVLFFKK